MALTVTMHLDQLRCIAESDGSGSSEPYLFVTYFWIDGRNIAQPDPASTLTPVYDGYRTEMPNNVQAGTVLSVPAFIGNATFEVDPGPLDFMLAGAIALLFEEDETPIAAVLAGRNAFISGFRDELNNLIRTRIQAQDKSPVTPQEAQAIADAVKPQIEAAIKSRLSFWQKLLDDQDDFIGYTYLAFTGAEIQSRSFVFPTIPLERGDNRYFLTGHMTVEPSPTRPVFDRCARERAALDAKEDEIRGRQLMRGTLQQQLQTASPSQKAACRCSRSRRLRPRSLRSRPSSPCSALRSTPARPAVRRRRRRLRGRGHPRLRSARGTDPRPRGGVQPEQRGLCLTVLSYSLKCWSSGSLAAHSESLAVGCLGGLEVPPVKLESVYRGGQQLMLFLQRRSPIRRCDLHQIVQGSEETAADLRGGVPGQADLVEGEVDVGVPVHRRDHAGAPSRRRRGSTPSGTRRRASWRSPSWSRSMACTAVVGSRNGDSDSDRSAMSTSIRNP